MYSEFGKQNRGWMVEGPSLRTCIESVDHGCLMSFAGFDWKFEDFEDNRARSKKKKQESGENVWAECQGILLR